MTIWVSRRLNWFLTPSGPEAGTIFQHWDKTGRSDIVLDGVTYRRLTPEWRAWLRGHCVDGLDPESRKQVESRQDGLKQAIEMHMPDLETVEIPVGYQPPWQATGEGVR